VRNVWIICRKEMRSYFVSPIGYAVIVLFAFIFGVVFYIATHDFANYAFRAQMSGGGMTLNVNEQIIRPILGFAGTVFLFLISLPLRSKILEL
jgi:ABC-2 type transport system permease protein